MVLDSVAFVHCFWCYVWHFMGFRQCDKLILTKTRLILAKFAQNGAQVTDHQKVRRFYLMQLVFAHTVYVRIEK